MDDIKTPQEGDLEKLIKEKDEYLNGWKRAKADLINYQKDEAKRFEELAKFAGRSMVQDIIPVLDSFDLASVTLEKNSPAEKGFLLIRSQLMEALRKYGLEKIKIEPGSQFDPMNHESVGEEASDHPSGTVVEEINSGYTMNGKMIRPAKVKIAK